MTDEIRVEPVLPAGPAEAAGSLALQASPDDAVLLTFRLTVPDETALEAVLYARRSILREERTLGIDPDEPSLEAAVFSFGEITWTVRRAQVESCLQRLEDLVRRANRTRQALRG